MNTQHVVVIGAGIGGLVSALELASKGVAVTLLERSAAVGGKVRTVTIQDHDIDAGPTVMTMRWVFDQLFDDIGKDLNQHLSLVPADVLARHFWGDDQELDLYADQARSEAAIEAFSGAAEAQRFANFCQHAADVYRTLEQPFMCTSNPTPLSLIQASGFSDMWQIKPFSTLWRLLGHYFHDPRLQQLFGRYATYCGSSPYQAPATLMLVSHVEQAGVWLVQGGMRRLAAVLLEIGLQAGVKIRYNAHVRRVVEKAGRATGVLLENGEVIEADKVVYNGDPAALQVGAESNSQTASRKPIKGIRRSLSALTWNLVTEPTEFPLDRHNVFFSSNYAAEFDDIFKHKRLPESPTVYLCAQDRGEPGQLSAAQQERMLLLVNAPATGDQQRIADDAVKRCETEVNRLLNNCGLKLNYSEEQATVTTPSDFNQLFPETGGALYGNLSHGWRASFSRPGASTAIKGLYLAGGGVHPGPGVPMAALSGRLAAATLLQDMVSESKRTRVALNSGSFIQPSGPNTNSLLTQ